MRAISQQPRDEAWFLDSVRGMGTLASCAPQLGQAGGEDTSPGGAPFRHLVLEEWLWEVTARREAVSEEGFRQWLEGIREARPRDEPAVGELRRRAAAEAREWLGRRRGPRAGAAADGYGSAPFLDLAAVFCRREVPEIYRHFSSFSEMDRGAGRATAGLLAVLLAQAVRESPYRAGFGAWFFNTAGRSLRTLRRVTRGSLKAPDSSWLERIEDRVVQGYERGREVAVPPSESPPEPPGAGPVDAMGLWDRLAFHLSAGGADLRRILGGFDPERRVDRLAGRLVGLMAGAWYGREALEEAWGGGIGEAETGLWRDLGVNPCLRAEMFYELSQLLLDPASAEARASS